MKSENISKHFHTLHVQRNEFLPHLHSLSKEQLWYRKEDKNGLLVNTFITYI